MADQTAPTDSTFARFARDECSPPERAIVERWLASHPEDIGRLDAIRRLVVSTEDAPDIDAQWSRLRLATVDAERQARPNLRIAAPAPRRVWRAAVLGGLLAIAASAVFLIQREDRAPVQLRSAAVTYTYYSTKRGEQSTIHLPDGSRVTLAPQSRLAIPSDYAEHARHVQLTGEAIFDVRHDSANVFEVMAKDVVVRDVGTRYDVRSYAAEHDVEVTVQEGAVEVEQRRQHVMLQRGMRAQMDSVTAPRVQRGMAVDRVFDWSTGRLSFENESLASVLSAIARWYQLDVRVQDPSLSTRRVTARFLTDRPDEMIEALASAVGAHAERRGSVVTLTGDAR